MQLIAKSEKGRGLPEFKEGFFFSSGPRKSQMPHIQTFLTKKMYNYDNNHHSHQLLYARSCAQFLLNPKNAVTYLSPTPNDDKAKAHPTVLSLTQAPWASILSV